MPQVHEGDFFWDKNARQQWPSVAEDQSKQLAEYREAIAEINRTTGAGINPDAVADDMQQVCCFVSYHRFPALLCHTLPQRKRRTLAMGHWIFVRCTLPDISNVLS